MSLKSYLQRKIIETEISFDLPHLSLICVCKFFRLDSMATIVRPPRINDSNVAAHGLQSPVLL